MFLSLLGLACLRYSFAEPLARLSYDLPFIWRANGDPQEVVLVYLDEYSAKELNQPADAVWDRRLHAHLLNRLTDEKARLVLYDIVFETPAADPEADAEFAATMQRHGRVVLGAGLDSAQGLGAVQERISAPNKLLRKAAYGYGVLAFKPVDPDYGVRRIYFGPSSAPTATWKAAEALGAPITQQPRESLRSEFWINYYGPRDTFSSVSFARALDPAGVPPGFFKNRIVLVGGRSSLGLLGSGRDDFATPYARSGYPTSPGAEVHATILLNLLHDEWMTRLAQGWEVAIVLCLGVAAGALGFFRPQFATIIAVLLAFGVMCSAWMMAWGHRTWFPWLIPSGIQLPLGLVWAVGSQYMLESRRRKDLKKAFGFYLSPQMADQIADSDFDLRPGGKLVEATVMFTDLENFTAMSENLEPTEVSSILTRYFGQTTRCILDKDGTIIKYIGDAVMAAWGAPVELPEHAVRATEAACDLRALSEVEVNGIKLRTRIGVHTGKVLAGNLGSEYRFDYSMIGDAVNFASRLEALNKHLGTQALISDAVQSRLGDNFMTRCLGEFVVAGKKQGVLIHELLCRREAEDGERRWIETFEEGLVCFRARDFKGAAALMQQTCQIRGGTDGPAEFYLRELGSLDAARCDENWRGVIELKSK